MNVVDRIVKWYKKEEINKIIMLDKQNEHDFVIIENLGNNSYDINGTTLNPGSTIYLPRLSAMTLIGTYYDPGLIMKEI